MEQSLVLQGPALVNPRPKVQTLWQCGFYHQTSGDDASLIVLGTLGTKPAFMTLGQLRLAAKTLPAELLKKGLAPGDSLVLVRLARTSEMAISCAYGALSMAGFRIFLPMYVDLESWKTWLNHCQARAVLWLVETLEHEQKPNDIKLAQQLSACCQQLGVLMLDLHHDLGIGRFLQLVEFGQPTSQVVLPQTISMETPAATEPEHECLILTTSGSTGRANLVVYTEKSLLNSCAAWEQAGLFSPDKLGGRSLCLLFAHSMGVRAFWNAVWTRSAMCLIPPEWFAEFPSRVRDMLAWMQPTHLVGGPAVFQTLLELSHFFPELKTTCYQSLQQLVSSGAPLSKNEIQQIKSNLDLIPKNAFGTTETMQIISTLVSGPLNNEGPVLGNLLPSVQIKLCPERSEPEQVYSLQVKNAFGAKCYLEDETQIHEPDGWFKTGDLVQYDGKQIIYLHRQSQAWVKDGFGVKISLPRLHQRYADLVRWVSTIHIEFWPLWHSPGIAALIFLDGKNGCEQLAAENRLVVDSKILDRVQSVIEAIHDSSRGQWDDFEIRHNSLNRFICVWGTPPKTSKGNISRGLIEKYFAQTLNTLCRLYVQKPWIRYLERDGLQVSDLARFAWPERARWMQLAGLDRHFIKASGDQLVYLQNGREHVVWDFVGGYGGNLFGHHQPNLTTAAEEILKGQESYLSDQGSFREAEATLAKMLSSLLTRDTGQSYVIRFGSSGSETVEMAIAHAYLEYRQQIENFCKQQRSLFGAKYGSEIQFIEQRAKELLQEPPAILILAGAFHGMSLGARTILGRDKGRIEFEPLMGLRRLLVSLSCTAEQLTKIMSNEDVLIPAFQLEQGQVTKIEKHLSRVIAAIVEPVRGEGGIVEVPKTLMAEMSKLNCPLIFDEIQCGLGRSGSFLASRPVVGDYYLFGKALGGGLAKISALAINRPRYQRRFDELYPSTFGGDNLSCRLAMAALALLERDNIPKMAALAGEKLSALLKALQQEYPTVIQSVEGVGLMQGITFASPEDSMLLRWAYQQDLFGILAAVFMFHRYHLRFLPTLSAPNTLRIEPSAYIQADAWPALSEGLRGFCRTVANNDAAEILLPWLHKPEMASLNSPKTKPKSMMRVESPAPGACRIAFLSHFVYPEEELVLGDASLKVFSKTDRRKLFETWTALLDGKPTIAFARNLFKNRVWFVNLILNMDAATIEQKIREDDLGNIHFNIQKAVELATELGCNIFALGAYTSIVTQDGESLPDYKPIQLTTGNTFTVAVGGLRIIKICRHYGIESHATTVAVVGATGNIGTAVLHWLVHEGKFRRLQLVGRDEQRLSMLADSLRKNASQELELNLFTDLSQLPKANVIVLAVNTTEPLLYPHHIGNNRPIIVSDLSVPPGVDPSVKNLPGVVCLPFAGTVPVLGAEDWLMASHIDPGRAFCCAAEAMLLGLCGPETKDLKWIGPIKHQQVIHLANLAKQYGFFADLES